MIDTYRNFENGFSKRVQEGCRKIRRMCGIFSYTLDCKSFIFVSVGIFYPLSRRIVSTTHALSASDGHSVVGLWLFCHLVKADSSRAEAHSDDQS